MHTALPAGTIGGQGIQPAACALFIAPLLDFVEFRLHKILHQAEKYGIRQSMNSDGGRCHDNARCESMWARMKTELFYGRIEPESMTVEQLKTLVWRYFISYWNRRRICSANDGLPPALKRQRFFAALDAAA